MTLQFPIPQFPGQAVRYAGQVWIWDGVAWHMDDAAAALDLSMVPAYLGQFVHRVVDGEDAPTFISLGDPDIYGATFALSTVEPLEGVKVYLNGTLQVLDDGSGAVGAYVVNRAANRIEFLVPLVADDTVTIGVLSPPEALAPGRVDVQPIKDLDTDWLTDPQNPTTGMVDGVRRTFDLLYDPGGGDQKFAVVGRSSDLAVFVGGVRQRPDVDYTTVGSKLTMMVAPQAGVPFWALWYQQGGSSSGGAISPPEPPLDGRSAYYGWTPGAGAAWLDGRGIAITVADALARAALRADIELVAGRLVHQADTQELWRWTGTDWVRYLDAGTFTTRLGGRVQVLRSSTALARPAAGSGLPGELWVNTADRVIGTYDGSNNPFDLIGLDANGYVDSRFFNPGQRPYGTVTPGAVVLTDWNDAHLSGTTVVRAPAGSLNRPPGSDLAYAGTYISMGDASTGVLTVASPNGNTVFVRPRAAGAWGAWIQVNSPGLDISSAMLRANDLSDVSNKANGRANLEVLFNPRTAYIASLNTLGEMGLYVLGAGVTNGWSGSGAGDAVLHVKSGTGLAVQMGLNRNAAAPVTQPLYFRFETAAGVWAPWVGVMTADEVSSAISAALTGYLPKTGGEITGNLIVNGDAAFLGDVSFDESPQVAQAPTTPTSVMRKADVEQLLDALGAATHIGDAPPASPKQGQLWFRTLTPIGLYVWLDDGDSAQWVQTQGGGSFSQSGAQGINAAGLSEVVFDQVPDTAVSLAISLANVTLSGGNVLLDFLGASAQSHSTLRHINGAAYAAPAALNAAEIELDNLGGTTGLMGTYYLERTSAQGANPVWMITGSHRRGNTMIGHAGRLILNGPWAPLRLRVSAGTFATNPVQCRWRT